jgi:hypothetical protein
MGAEKAQERVVRAPIPLQVPPNIDCLINR